MSPETSTASPALTDAGAISRSCSTTPMPAVFTYTPSPLPRSTTFVSPVTSATPACSAAALIDETTRQSVSIASPSSRMKPALRYSGRAPHMARSFTVPLTASVPMSPPGKNSGRTTYESVVNASRLPPTSTRAPSCRAPRAGFANAGTNSRSISWCVSCPPPPCASMTCGYRLIGIGQLGPHSKAFGSSAMSVALPCLCHRRQPPVAEVRGTRPFRRHHRCAQRLLRRAPCAKRAALVRPFQPLQDEAADALGRFVDNAIGHVESRFRIECAVGLPEPQATPGDLPDPPPLAVDDLEHLAHRVLRRHVALAPDRARVLILDLGTPLLELLHAHVHTLEQVQRLETGHDDRHPVLRGQRLVLGEAHHGAHVTRGKKPLHQVRARGEDRFHRGGHEHVRDEDGEVRDGLACRLVHRHRVGRRGSLEPNRKEHHLAIRHVACELHRVERGVHDPHVTAGSLHGEEVPRLPLNAQHVA